MTKQTLTHRTQTGHVFTRTTAASYAYVTVGTRRDDSWNGAYQTGDQVVLGWHTNPPSSFKSVDRYDAFAAKHVEAVNGGQA